MIASEDMRAAYMAIRALIAAWTSLPEQERALSVPFGRHRIERLALLAIAGAWDELRLNNIADANCCASAAALLLKLPELSRLGDEALKEAVASVLDDRAEVFLAIVADFGLPRGERTAAQGKPSAPTLRPLDEPEFPF